MAVVFEPVALSAAWRQRQHGVQAIQRLNGRLLIHTKHGRMLRWVQIKPDDIRGLAFEVRIVAGHVAFQAVRLQSGFLPYAMHHVLAHVDRRSQLAAAPVRGSVFRFSSEWLPESWLAKRASARRPSARMVRIQSFHAGLHKPLFPARDRRRGWFAGDPG